MRMEFLSYFNLILFSKGENIAMKILLYADTHFSLNSSILLGSTDSLQGRLEHLVNSFRWMYELAKEKRVDLIVDLGDLVDSSKLSATEITAVSEALSFNKDIPELHILGNHERQSENGRINSINFINLMNNHRLIVEPEQIDNRYSFIPYQNYKDGDLDELPNTEYAFTHIDIKGFLLGGTWTLKTGLTPDYLMSKYDYIVNGHLHTGGYVVNNLYKTILNLGSISGQNFSSKGNPRIGILDSESRDMKFIDNPYGIRFDSVVCNTLSEVIELNKSIVNSDNNFCIQIKVPIHLVEDTSKILESNNKILAKKIKIDSEKVVISENLEDSLTESIERVSGKEEGFNKLREFLENKNKLPYKLESILPVVNELERMNLNG